jgi:hypothetical protein
MVSTNQTLVWIILNVQNILTTQMYIRRRRTYATGLHTKGYASTLRSAYCKGKLSD